MTEKTTMQAIARMVPPGSRVLDLGCGDGALLSYLQRERGCSGYGIEIDDANVLACVQRGVDVIQLNLDEGLAMFGDNSFDVVLQIDTLQHLRNAEVMLRETARVGRTGVWPSQLRALAQPPVGAARAHAGHAPPALPVVRHAQYPCGHLQGFRGARAQEPATRDRCVRPAEWAPHPLVPQRAGGHGRVPLRARLKRTTGRMPPEPLL